MPSQIPCMMALAEGETVSLFDLNARADLNGQEAQLLQWLGDRERWVVRVRGTEELVRIKPANMRRPLAAVPTHGELVNYSGHLRGRFMDVVKGHGFDQPSRTEEIAEYMTSRDAADVTCSAFARRFGTSQEDAEAFLEWLNIGLQFSEELDCIRE